MALTAPYGHNGAFDTLEGIIRHHLNPIQSFDRWKLAQANLPNIPWLNAVDGVAFDDKPERNRIRSKFDITPVNLTDPEIADLVSFLKSLTGTTSVKGRLGKPKAVPSGLPID